MKKKLFSVLALLAISLPLPAEILHGVVLEEDEPVAMAEVMLMDASSNVLITRVETDGKGKYRFSVGPGVYNIRAFKEEYIYVWVKEIVIDGADAVVNIAMTPEAFAEKGSAPKSDDCD